MEKYTYKFQRGLLEDAKVIRFEVFIDEQCFIDELEEKDDWCYHLVIYKDGYPIATSRLEDLGNSNFKLSRVAIRKLYRGQGLGSHLLNKTEEEARKLGAKTLYVDSQFDKREFYFKNDYLNAKKPIFLEENYPHILLYKNL
jgi:Predicted acyltransferase